MTLFHKLKLKNQDRLLTLHAPANFKKRLIGLSNGIKIITAGNEFDQIHWFVFTKTQLQKELNKVVGKLHLSTILWTYFPKRSSDISTDLTKNIVLTALSTHKGEVKYLSLISFDENWSAFGWRLKTAADIKKEKRKPKREVFDWVNPQTKEVRLPEALSKAFAKNKKVANLFHSLAFTHKKEYIEWIITAKKEETQKKRIQGTIDRLQKQLAPSYNPNE